MEVSFSYNSNLKRLRVFKDAKLVQEIIGDKAITTYLKIIKE